MASSIFSSVSRVDGATICNSFFTVLTPSSPTVIPSAARFSVEHIIYLADRCTYSLREDSTIRWVPVGQDDSAEGAVHFQFAVASVVDTAQFAELFHEETDAGARGADHLGERFLTDLRHDRRLTAFALGVSQQQQCPCQPLLGRIKELIDQVILEA